MYCNDFRSSRATSRAAPLETRFVWTTSKSPRDLSNRFRGGKEDQILMSMLPCQVDEFSHQKCATRRDEPASFGLTEKGGIETLSEQVRGRI